MSTPIVSGGPTYELVISPQAPMVVEVASPGPPGVVDIAISHTQTGALTTQIGVYDLELISPGGAVERVLKGSVKVDFEVTR